ncbi:MAG TPA: LD-carboxypeptidase [Lacipirellulaceae bacterium]|nr:LD-carboxypeptidase [Lacipirellulaceae bacterium]
MAPLKPKALRRGDAISVVVPAGPVNRERIDRALERLRGRGFRTKLYGDIYRSQGYLAGDDETRAEELMAAFRDPETTGIWCARGGYGVARLLHRIDFDLIRRHPKVVLGFSDITALHIAIHQRTDLVTYHGPNLQDGFGGENEMLPANEAALWQAILADNQSNAALGYAYDLAAIENIELRTLSGGASRGRMIGGNLAVLAGLMGTPFEVDTAGRILFLEDVGERLYRIDRYLSQLRLAGKLQAAAGVLLGSFSFNDDEPSESEAAVGALLEDYFSRLDVPVLAGFPAGHAKYNMTLPIGALVEIDANKKQVRVCEQTVAF